MFHCTSIQRAVCTLSIVTSDILIQERYKWTFKMTKKRTKFQIHKCAESQPVMLHRADVCRTVFQSTVKRFVCVFNVLRWELSLRRLFYLRAFAQLHSLYALTLWTRVSPCGTMCRCVAFSLFLFTVYLCSNYQTAFESCKHANDFLWAHQFFRHLKLPECMHACIQWLMSLFTWLCMVCLLCLVSRFHTSYVCASHSQW